MSIPERLYRIARHKLAEVKDRFDRLDAEAEPDPEVERKLQRTEARAGARRELDEGPVDSGAGSANPPPRSVAMPSPVGRNTTGGANPASSTSAASGGAATSAQNVGSDPLAYHYRLLGVEPGADFGTVQDAFNKLAARSDPGRFPAGSEDARAAQQIRDRVEASYRILRDALDSTARRFDLLEFDKPPPRPE